MTDDLSPNLSLPFLMPSQAQKHVTHNEALERLDLLVQLVVAGFDATEPPALPQEGAVHALGLAPDGAWAGQGARLATWQGGAWVFIAPRPGWRAWGLDGGGLRVWTGTEWVPAAVPETLPELGINTSADAVNRLAVASAATLLTHEGAGHQLKINKAAADDTASLLFQTGWSGRAEMGLAGNDDFSIKVSPDGGVWVPALVLSPEAVQIDLPITGSAVTQAPDDTTPGRLVRVQDIRSQSGGAPLSDFHDIPGAVHGQMYSWDSSTLNAPAGGGGGALMLKRDSDRGSWLAFRAVNSDVVELWLKSTTDAAGTPSAWALVHHTGNLLGTVSQSGGTPTGAVIERGANANGEYVRWADGTQICWNSNIFESEITTSTGAIHNTGSEAWEFPVQFSAPPATSLTATRVSSGTASPWAGGGPGHASASQMRAMLFAATEGVSGRASGMAIGRWY